MTYGDTPYDEMLKQAWDEFCDRLKGAGSLIFRPDAPSTALDRAVGFRYLSRQISRGLDIALEYDDPLFPNLRRNQYPTRKYGGDNPDALNMRARIDGEHTYRVVGNRGTVRYVVFSIHRPSPNTPWQEQEVTRLLGQELQTKWDGRFEIILSPEEHPGNWLKTTPDTHQISIRQFHGDWHLEQPMTLRIERVGAEGETPAPLMPETVAEGLRNAADIADKNSVYWVDWMDYYREKPNEFQTRGTNFAALGGTPGGTAWNTYWMVQPDEALLIEVTPPRRFQFWNIEFNNFWMETVDYRYLFSGLNSQLAVLEEDGSLRVAVAHTDPGLANLIETGGHCEGHIVVRWMQADSSPRPDARLIKLADLPSVVPPNTRRVTPEQRLEQRRLRKIGVDRRFRV